MIAIITTSHFSVLRSSAAKIGFLEQDENNWIVSLYTKWEQIMFDTRPRTLANPAEIECFLNIGARLTVSVLSHVCDSRSRETTQCALKAMTLSHALIHWPLDRLCFVGWNEENETEKYWLTFSSSLHQSFSVVLRSSAVYLRISIVKWIWIYVHVIFFVKDIKQFSTPILISLFSQIEVTRYIANYELTKSCQRSLGSCSNIKQQWRTYTCLSIKTKLNVYDLSVFNSTRPAAIQRVTRLSRGLGRGKDWEILNQWLRVCYNCERFYLGKCVKTL